MISHEHRIIFVHVPKAAGTSVEAVLGHHGELGLRTGVQDHRTLRQLQWPHAALGYLRSLDNAREAGRAIKARFRADENSANRRTVSRAQYESYLKFGIVRNPWSRAYSWYSNVIADPLHRQRLQVPEDLRFGDFIERFAAVDLLRPQPHWLIDVSGRIGVDVVCRYETLAADFAAVCERVGIPPKPLPIMNETHGGSYVDAYDDRSRRVIAERHRREIELFDYSFDA